MKREWVKPSEELILKRKRAAMKAALKQIEGRPRLGQVYKCGKYFGIRVGRFHKLLHRYVWELYNGPIPKGCIIHHKNGNTACNCICNLQVVTSKEHSAIHRNKHVVASAEIEPNLQ